MHFRFDNSSKIDKYIRSVNCQNAIPNSVYLDSATADSDLEKSSLFNSFFTPPSLTAPFISLAVYQPFHHLFCLSLSQHYIPVEWRTHMVRPIFKSGDRNSVKNYIPISLLCVTSKVLERIVYNHIIDFVNNSISPYQFGFLRHRSTLQQLLLF